MFKGKMKAVTFSYDDGVTQDIRLIEMLDRYGLKGTFNLNSELLGKPGSLVREGVRVDHNKIAPSDVRAIYGGHEVAVHTLTHPTLPKCDDAEIVRQVERDRENLSALAGYEVVGMAYPGGGVNNDDRVAAVIREQTGVKYARTTACTYDFLPQQNLYRFCPSVYHIMESERMFALAEKFLSLDATTPQIFYVWGHSYEFDIHNTWDEMERFCALISGRDDIFYGTNREILLPNADASECTKGL